MRDRLLRIGIYSGLIASVVSVGGRMLLSGVSTAPQRSEGEGDTPSLPSEAGVFRMAPSALAIRKTVSESGLPGERKLAGFYRRRAYPGAPPVIPHRLLNPSAWGGSSCLGCHADGGYTPEFNAMAPVTPHPDLVSCVQCHVPNPDGAALFRRTVFTPADAPPVKGGVLPGSPPPIPHDLSMRSNCLACHAGPGAVKELRMDHPERVNCRQCHAWNWNPVSAFERMNR